MHRIYKMQENAKSAKNEQNVKTAEKERLQKFQRMHK